MRTLISYMSRRMKENFTFWDYGFLKTYGFLAGLLVGAFFPLVIKEVAWFIVALFLILLFRYVYLLFLERGKEE